MTVEQMIVQRTTELTAIKAASNAAVAAKGGTPADNLSGLPAAIESIPSGGDLPKLTTPAEAGHVLAGKEYIDGNGDKKSGTLVVCDSIVEVESSGIAGTGVSLELESTADGSTKIMTLPEPNLVAENIVAGSSIFGVPGTAKTLRVETGTITPAEDTTTLTIPCSDAPKYAVIYTTSEEMKNNDMLGVIINNVGRTELFRGNCFLSYYYSNRIGLSTTEADTDHGIVVPELANYLYFRAGVDHKWAAYYWGDA